jgi:hypothetical protein
MGNIFQVVGCVEEDKNSFFVVFFHLFKLVRGTMENANLSVIYSKDGCLNCTEERLFL